jgi:hypothetical protein
MKLYDHGIHLIQNILHRQSVHENQCVTGNHKKEVNVAEDNVMAGALNSHAKAENSIKELQRAQTQAITISTLLIN